MQIKQRIIVSHCCNIINLETEACLLIVDDVKKMKVTLLDQLCVCV